MKNIIITSLTIGLLAFVSACKKDEGNLPAISFKTGGSYLSHDDSVATGSAILIGINAEKTEDKDVLKKFNLSKSVNGGTDNTIYSKDLSGGEGNNYSFDYKDTLKGASGDKTKYTFTVTNRDGLVNNVSLTVKIKK